MRVGFYGGVEGVTGSCFLLEVDNKKILIDCGLFQGTEEQKNYEPFPFEPKGIDYLILTHAHIDHCGRIPLLVKEGFRGRIISTEATKRIAILMLLDAAKVMYENYKVQLKKLLRTGKVPSPPLYQDYEVLDSIDFFNIGLTYGRSFSISNNVKVTFKDAGHILGSAFVEIEVYENKKNKRIVFSGDLGNKGKPIIRDPQKPSKADYVFVETTYGDRNHKGFEESKEELLEAVTYALSRGGNVLIPSYALERAQEILFVLRDFYENGKLPECRVFLDSPLATNLTALFKSHPEFFDEETYQIFLERDPFKFPNLYFTKEVEESKSINSITSGAIIIAGSGMLTGGRILHHLKHNLWRPECSLVFVGYQPKGTLGRRIIEGESPVKIFGEEIEVKARIYTINGFSSHTDQKGLLEWLSFTQKPKKVFLIHGEKEKKEVFKQKLIDTLGFKPHLPIYGEVIDL